MIKIKKISLLNEKQINGENKLEVLTKYGLSCEVTDLAIITGSLNRDMKYNVEVPYQIIKFNSQNTVIDKDGQIKTIPQNDVSNATIRPVLTIEEKIPYYLNENIPETIYGSIPQTACSYNQNSKIETHYNQNLLRKTGQNYYLPSLTDETFKLYPEYEFANQKYIRILSYQKNNLSNGKIYNINKPIWLKVEPVIWLYDQKTNTLISKYGLLAGLKNYNEDEIDKLLNHFLIELPSQAKLNPLNLEKIIKDLNNQNLENLTLEELKELKEQLQILKTLTNLEEKIADECIKQKKLPL